MLHRFYFLLLLLCMAGLPLCGMAQIQSVHIGVNGLTCSQCTRNVEMSLRKLPFVQDVKMNLEHTDGVITLKPKIIFNPRAIAKAVKDAGFSLRFFTATLDFTRLSTDEPCFEIYGDSYNLMGQKVVPQQPEVVQFIDDGFMPAAALKKWRPLMIPTCQPVPISNEYFITLVKGKLK